MISSSRAMTSERFFRIADADSKRGSSNRSGRPRARHTAGMWRSISSPVKKNQRPSPAIGVHQRSLIGVPRFRGRDLAEGHLQSEVPSEHIGPGTEQRYLDHLALSGLTLLEYRGQHAGHRGERGDVVADAATCVQRHAVGVGHLYGETRPGPECADVVNRSVPVVTPQSEPAHRAVDQARMALDGRRGLEVEAVEGIEAKIAHEHVRPLEEFLHVPPIRRIAQVEHDTALTSVVQREAGLATSAPMPRDSNT